MSSCRIALAPVLSFYQTEPLLHTVIPPATLDVFFLSDLPCVLKFGICFHSINCLNREFSYQPYSYVFELHDID